MCFDSVRDCNKGTIQATNLFFFLFFFGGGGGGEGGINVIPQAVCSPPHVRLFSPLGNQIRERERERERDFPASSSAMVHNGAGVCRFVLRARM